MEYFQGDAKLDEYKNSRTSRGTGRGNNFI